MEAQATIGMTKYSDIFDGQNSSNYFADPALNNVYPIMTQQQLLLTLTVCFHARSNCIKQHCT